MSRVRALWAALASAAVSAAVVYVAVAPYTEPH